MSESDVAVRALVAGHGDFAAGIVSAVHQITGRGEAFVVLWWVRAGHRPGIEEAIEKLELLRATGPSESAFTFKKAFPPPDAAKDRIPFALGDECPAT